MRQFLLVILLVTFAATIAGADDLLPPSWRGELGSAGWQWDTWGGGPDLGTINPDNSWGSLSGTAEAPGGLLLFSQDGRQNVLQVNGPQGLWFDLDNFDQHNPLKHVHVQITTGPQSMPLSGFEVMQRVDNVWQGPFTYAVGAGAELEAMVSTGDGWVTTAYSFDLTPNPQAETIFLDFMGYPAYIDQVVIDTWCEGVIPEPATLSLLALGGLALACRRRR